MMASELYDMIKQIITDKAHAGHVPSWYYFYTKLIIKIHLCEKIETIQWRLR